MIRFAVLGLTILPLLSACAGGSDTGASRSAPVTPIHTSSSAGAPAAATTAANGGPSVSRQATSTSAAAVHANELGRIMVLEYHNIRDHPSDVYSQSAAQLRGDLQLLYDKGYRTIDVHDYLSGNISTPAGKTPVVLTFDDASKYQFRYTDEKSKTMDPDCAVAILDRFGASHPDFGNHATFFVLPEGFAQPATKADKYRYLVSHGYTIGNHTTTHPIMTHLSPAKVQEELGKDDADIHSILPDYTVDVLAYPFGTRPKTNKKPDNTYIASGSWQGRPYHIKAAFLVGAEPAPSPFNVKFSAYAIPRVQAIEKDLVRWVTYFDSHPRERFISDGSASTISVPATLAGRLRPGAEGSRTVVKW